MRTKDLQLAERVAVFLADELSATLPDCFTVPGDALVEAMWPMAVRLVLLQRKARKHKKAARRLRREVAGLLELIGEAPETLTGFVPFDPARWSVQLVPSDRMAAGEAA
jgi:hypothetical protein